MPAVPFDHPKGELDIILCSSDPVDLHVYQTIPSVAFLCLTGMFYPSPPQALLPQTSSSTMPIVDADHRHGIQSSSSPKSCCMQSCERAIRCYPGRGLPSVDLPLAAIPTILNALEKYERGLSSCGRCIPQQAAPGGLYLDVHYL